MLELELTQHIPQQGGIEMGSGKFLQRFPRLNAAYKGYRESKNRVRPPVKNPIGFWFSGNNSMERGEFEPQETEIVQGLLPNVDVLINIGANIGYYCCIALSQNKKVIAFEPFPRNLETLMHNVAMNGWDDAIEIFPLALSDHCGIAKFYGAGTGASLIQGWAGQSDHQLTLVPMSTLDLVLGQRMRDQRCLVLIDVEGAELRMLQKATQLLANEPRPIWLVEISINEHQPSGIPINPNLEATFELFFRAGYRAFTADQVAREVQIEEVREIANSGNDTLRIHNFIFRD